MRSSVRKPASRSLVGVLALLAAVAPLRADEPAKGEDGSGAVREFPYGSYIYQVAFSPDGKLVVTDDQVWDAATGKKVRTLPLLPLKERPFTPFRLAFSPDGRQIAVHRFDDMVLVETATGKEVWTIKLPPRKHRPDEPGLVFTPDGKQIVTARPDEGMVRVWEAATGKEVRSFAYDRADGGLRGAFLTGGLAVSADCKRLVVQSHEPVLRERGGLKMLDLETGKELARHRVSEEKAWVDFSTPSPDAGHVFYAKASAVHLIDLTTGKETRRFAGVGVYAFHVACSPDGKYVAATVRETKDSKEDWIQCWEVATGKTVRVIKGHKGMVGPLAFSPDGKAILAACDDKTARLWRLTE